MCSRAKEARNNSSSVAPFRHAFETGGERTVRLARARSDRLGRIGDAGAGVNARRSVAIPPSLFQYRNFALIRFDACAILRASAFRSSPFFFPECAGSAPPVRRFMRMLRRDRLRCSLRHCKHDKSPCKRAIGTISPAVSCLQEAGALSCSWQLLTKSTRIESGTFWNRKSWGCLQHSEEKEKCVLILRSRQPPR